MYIYTSEQIYHVDKTASQQGLSPFSLMENAGRGIFERIVPLISRDQTIGIVAGRGNNGGDGIVLARYLKNAGYQVSLMFPLGQPTSDVAKKHLTYYLAQGYTIEKWDRSLTFAVIVDSLLGVGARLPLRENVQKVICWANENPALRIAVDLPTGVLANKGLIETGADLVDDSVHSVGKSEFKFTDQTERTQNDTNGMREQFSSEMMKEAPFKAAYTISLHGAKPSAFLYPSSYYYGTLHVVSIGLAHTSHVKTIDQNEVVTLLPNRVSSGHKGTFGTSLLVAGTDDMPGSIALSAIGVIRSGTGRLIVATSDGAIPIVATHVPEATFMANGLERISSGDIPDNIAAVGIGPGLTDRDLTQRALEQLMIVNIPIVVDAGALEKRDSWEASGPVVITPHPGEFSRLTGYSIEEIEANRIELASAYAQKHHIIVVLKGEFTVIAFPNGKVRINVTGNTGLAKGGSGDVLTGMLVSFLATYDNVEAAVINAVFIHGLCADEWAENYSEAAMTASDFASLLPKVLKSLERYRY